MIPDGSSVEVALGPGADCIGITVAVERIMEASLEDSMDGRAEMAALELTALMGESGQAVCPDKRAPEKTHAAEDTVVVSPENETLDIGVEDGMTTSVSLEIAVLAIVIEEAELVV